MEKKSGKATDSTESLGLYKREKFDSSKLGAQGNDKGNQRPVAQTTSIGGGQKIKQ